jgi:hypothetical protein
MTIVRRYCAIVFSMLVLAGISASAEPARTGSFGPWEKNLANLRNQYGLSKEAVANTSQAQVALVLTGYCYQGAGTTTPIDTGSFKFCMQAVNSDGSIACSNWNQVYYTGSVSTGGKISSFNYVSIGTYYIVLNFPPFALQWWDGKNISEQPVPVTISHDTMAVEFHFVMGCSISGKIRNSDNSRFPGDLRLMDTTGLEIFRVYPDTAGNFLFTGVPVGTYYLYCYYGTYVNPYYPDAQYANTAQKLIFTTPGASIAGLSWRVQPKTVISHNSQTGKLLLSNPDSSGTGIAVTYANVEGRNFHYMSTSSDTVSTYAPSNEKYFVARLLNWSDPSLISLSYYPGSFLRSLADTIQLQTYQIVNLPLPIARGGKLSCQLPAFSDSALFFEPMFITNNIYQSLGAEPNLQSGRLVMYAPADSYSLWCVPMTQGHKQAQGWQAFKKDSVVITNDKTTVLSNFPAKSASASVEGTTVSTQDPLLACFDTLGHCASMTVLPQYRYFEQQTGNRWKSFYFSMIYSPPYQMVFDVNFLPPGRYALVKVEPPDSLPGQHTVRWYGGLSYAKTIFEFDDVASLTVPQNVTWLTISNAGQVLQVGQWKEPVFQNVRANKSTPGFGIRTLQGNKVAVQIPFSCETGTIHIFDISGKTILSRKIQHGERTVIIGLGDCRAHELLLFRLNFGKQIFTTKSFVGFL